MSKSYNSLLQKFSSLFGQATSTLHAPGRINIIGEHTDYNNGYVLPASIDKKLSFAFAKNNLNGLVRIHALNLDEYLEFSLKDARPDTKGWLKYIMAITNTFLENDQGFDCVFGGDLPIGSGMSSSSALTCGLAAGLNNLFELNYKPIDLVKRVQDAEAKYTGVRGGIMDQFTIAMGKENQVILLDCKSLEYQYFPLILGDHALLLCNTGVQHELANSEYNTRRSECEQGVAFLQSKGEKIESLREVSLAMINRYREHLDSIIFDRCYYVVKENARVMEACKAMQNNDMATLGALLYASHYGLQHEYHVSCLELDFLVKQTQGMPEVLGARMMGGGFGGCTINLVEKAALDRVIDQLATQYLATFNRKMESYKVAVGPGVFHSQ